MSATGTEMVKQALRATAACPSETELAGLVEAALPAADRERVEAHASGCTRCAGEIALLRAFLLARPEGGDAAAVNWIAAQLDRRAGELFGAPRPRHWEWIRAWLTPLRLSGAAVALATVLLLTGAVLQFRSMREPVLTAQLNPVQVLRSGSIATTAPQGDLDAAPTRLSWTAVSGAARYEVRVLEVDQNVVWSGVSDAAATELPEAVQRLFVPGKTLFWQVSAFNAAGELLGSASPVRVRVRVR